eukprot:COSAG01_NODE_6277_length_3758_cov_10.169719_2_plen_148_part_00
MLAADFDSLVGDWAAVGPSYYALSRTLWDPASANRTAILDEYYDAFGSAGPAMRAYYGYWRSFVQRVYTDPAVLARVAQYEDRRSARYLGGGRAQYVMGEPIDTTPRSIDTTPRPTDKKHPARAVWRSGGDLHRGGAGSGVCAAGPG